MTERTVTAEAVRRSRADQSAAELAAEAQRRARDARLEAAERRVHRAVQTLGAVLMALWLVGLIVLVIVEVVF